MTKRVLVTYATRAGSTVDIAAAIGKTLAARGFAVDVKPIKDNPAVGEYQAVVIGSAVRVGRWVSEAVKFVTANQQSLKTVPVAVFCVHGNNLENDEQSRAARHAYLDNIRTLIQPVDEVFFAGNVDPKRVSLLERVMINAVKSPTGDFRNWEKINAWAETLFA
jgi:menaquinone-dependent protoporphyrinogen oxidase